MYINNAIHFPSTLIINNNNSATTIIIYWDLFDLCSQISVIIILYNNNNSKQALGGVGRLAKTVSLLYQFEHLPNGNGLTCKDNRSKKKRVNIISLRTHCHVVTAKL